jgi:hypothetical protein
MDIIYNCNVCSLDPFRYCAETMRLNVDGLLGTVQYSSAQVFGYDHCIAVLDPTLHFDSDKDPIVLLCIVLKKKDFY